MLERSHWSDVAEVLHGLLTAIVSRGQYPEGHPTIERADESATVLFARFHKKAPELAVALIEGEIVIDDRPLPDLKTRMPALVDALVRHGIECLVFLQGIDLHEVSMLAAALAGTADAARPNAIRERIQSELRHVLVRFVSLRELERSDYDQEEASRREIEPLVVALLGALGEQIRARAALDLEHVRKVARLVVQRVDARKFAVRMRRQDEGPLDLPGHSSNVATMTAAIAREARLPDWLVTEITSAALVHDVGELLLPEALQGIPEPLLDERGSKYARHHPLLGARALLEGGAPPLWVATALDHHRGIDARGYPSFSGDLPHDATRIVTIANYLERKRIPLGEDPEAPEAAVRSAMTLVGRYFDPTWLAVALRALGVFPPGMVVELTDGQPAMVTRANPRDPLRPEVRLLFGDDAGKRVDLSAFDAMERRYHRSIVRALLPKIGVSAKSRYPLPMDD
jgi:HD-GYP domain-containing protein (c-di-GMP phosphodiesterase class II)